MNIQPVKTDAVQVPSKTRPKSAPGAAEPSGAPANETTASRNERLTEALAKEPDIRPEVLERARELASDPNYPGPNVFAKLAARLVQEAKKLK
jgi:hypothetical protein